MMNHTFRIFLLILFIAFISCKKDTEEENPPIVQPTIAEGYMKVDIDGVTYQDTSKAYILNYPEVKLLKLSIDSTLTSIKSIDFNLVFYMALGGSFSQGEYENINGNCMIETNEACVAFEYFINHLNINETQSSYSIKSNVSVTSLDFSVGGHIKGLFSGRIEGDDAFYEITNGEFNLIIAE